MKTKILILAILLSGCTQADKSRELLESNGYTSIEITGYKYFGCSEDDQYHTGFRAKGPTGKQLKGTVCAGLLFKGATIRFD